MSLPRTSHKQVSDKNNGTTREKPNYILGPPIIKVQAFDGHKSKV